jgi:hypothetical protein
MALKLFSNPFLLNTFRNGARSEYTLIIHPNYAALAGALGFQKTSSDPKMPLYWMYQAVDRFLKLDMQKL